MRLLIATLAFLSIPSVHADDWPQWRGPNHDNIAAPSAKPVTEWSADKNVRWKTPIPGRGHSTPIVVGSVIYLTTADLGANKQSLIAIDRKAGKVIWNTTIHEQKLPSEVHKENSRASATAQWTGDHVLVTFQNDEKVMVSAVTPDGEITWTKSAGDYRPLYSFGYGSTPVLHNELYIVVIGTKDNGSVVAMDAKSGEIKWRTPHDGHDNWATPVVATVAGKEQLLLSGVGLLTSFDPKTGKKLWSAPLSPQSTCGTVVWTDDMVFASGGYPSNQTAGIKADGSGTVVWKNPERCYEQSLLSHDGLIYAVTDSGIAFCWDAATGERVWKERVGRGGIMASPLLVGDLIYTTFKNGKTTIFKAGRSFEKVAENQLGDDTYATPVAVGDDLLIRVGKVTEGERSEMLYCLGD
ncbi:MAG: PQQ-binding-like beta-propeller repeat protein [Verrucomicrobiota bacterium]